jgi:hypothetical protein
MEVNKDRKAQEIYGASSGSRGRFLGVKLKENNKEPGMDKSRIPFWRGSFCSKARSIFARKWFWKKSRVRSFAGKLERPDKEVFGS